MKRWNNYSKDPNAPEVLSERAIALKRARTGTLVSDRVAYLCELARDKVVLDIGVVEHTLDAAQSPNWLHGNIRRCSARCTGVDVLKDEVEQLRSQGYNVVCADLTKETLADTFEVIIAGEVLEHLDSPGSFMANCSAMLRAGGRLVLTAPNPWYANVILKSVRSRKVFVDSADHVGWYDASVLYELGHRHGLELRSFSGIAGSSPRTVKAKLFFKLRPLLIGCGLKPELFAKSIIYEFVRL